MRPPSDDPAKVCAFSYPTSKQPILDEFEKIARVKGTRFRSRKIMELIEEYVIANCDVVDEWVAQHPEI